MLLSKPLDNNVMEKPHYRTHYQNGSTLDSGMGINVVSKYLLFDGLVICFFNGLRLLFFLNVTRATFIEGATSIPDSKVAHIFELSIVRFRPKI